MLTRLVIKNFAIIDQLDIALARGLNIITGETGAGKSIVVGALSLLLGQRADLRSLFKTTIKCTIEGTFKIADYNLEGFFQENDLDYEEQSILRREISAEGKSRAFINDTPVSLAVLKELGYLLVDIHSQHETLDINTEAFQVKVLDLVAGQESASVDFRNALRQYNRDEKKLQELITLHEAALEETGYLEFQLDELRKAALNDSEEQTSLEREFEELSHAEEIQTGLAAAFNSLEEDDLAALEKIRQAMGNLSAVERYFSRITPLIGRLKSVQIETRDISAELESLAADISTNPKRLAAVQERLDLIFSLQKKHRKASIEELMAYRDSLVTQLGEVESSADQIEELRQDLEQQTKQLGISTERLSIGRATVIPRIEQEIHSLLSELGMTGAAFRVEQKTDASRFSSYGVDKIRFLFSANKGFEPGELSKIASGGELSRLMLAIKSLSSRYASMPTVIFDEIDTGVSGEIALKVGRVMEALATSNQVIAITHLPQIASRGSSHFFVYKDLKNGVTHTNLRVLAEEERIEEIAKMLSGNDPGEYALKNARELLTRS